jgi:hypothetical protein
MLEEALEGRRGFQYGFSSRKYWKILEFQPGFGFKGKDATH